MSNFIGAQHITDRIWPEGVKISGITPAFEECVADPYLPSQGLDPRYGSSDQIVIPRGRVVAIRRDTTSYTGKAVLTLADGSSNTPVGYSEHNIFRKLQYREQSNPMFDRQSVIEVPYVSLVNGAYGTIGGGDYLTAYYGSATSRTKTPNHVGKLVKWVEKKVYNHTAVASATHALSSANLPAFTPRIIACWNAGVPSPSSGATLAWNEDYDKWVVTLGAAATVVLYEWGQGPEQIVGQALRVEPISASHHLPGWLEWVTDDFMSWEYPQMLRRVPVTAVTAETPSTVVAGSQYRLANKPVAPWKEITVTVTGSKVARDGTVTTLTDTELSRASFPYNNYLVGEDYDINPLTGDLYFSNNITVTSVTVDYYYETSYRDGIVWNSGIIGLTDGANSGIPGTPANLDVADVVGSLRAMIF